MFKPKIDKGIEALKTTIEEQSKAVADLVERLEKVEAKRDAERASNDVIFNALQVRRKAQLEIFPLLSGAFTTGLVLTFAYQVYKSTEIANQFNEAKKEVREIEIRGQQLQKLKDNFEVQRDDQARLSGHMTRSLVLTSIGYRDSARGREFSAFRKSEVALRELEEYLPLLDVVRGVKSSATLSESQRNRLESLRPSIPALLEATIAGYELMGRTSVLLYNIDNQEFILKTSNAGKRIYELAPERWEGPHFIALGYDNLADYTKDPVERARLRREAQKHYAIAIRNDPVNASVDMINLAESYFIVGNYDDSSLYAQRYLDQEKSLAPEENKLVATFYKNLSNYASKGQMKFAQNTFGVICGIPGNLSKVKNYSWEPLKELAKRGTRGFKASDKQAQVMHNAVMALLDAVSGISEKDIKTKYGNYFE